MGRACLSGQNLGFKQTVPQTFYHLRVCNEGLEPQSDVEATASEAEVDAGRVPGESGKLF